MGRAVWTGRFIVIYRIEADRVLIGRIFHGRQDRG